MHVLVSNRSIFKELWPFACSWLVALMHILPLSGAGWRGTGAFGRCCQTLMADIICCYTNWMNLSLVVGFLSYLLSNSLSLFAGVSCSLVSGLGGWDPLNWLTDPSNDPVGALIGLQIEDSLARYCSHSKSPVYRRPD